jgi:hypothetical protein
MNYLRGDDTQEPDYEFLSTLKFRSAKNQAALEVEFVSIWCAGHEVLCKCNLFHLCWNLSPPCPTNYDGSLSHNWISGSLSFGLINLLDLPQK